MGLPDGTRERDARAEVDEGLGVDASPVEERKIDGGANLGKGNRPLTLVRGSIRACQRWGGGMISSKISSQIRG